jgi:hypothetical protein
MVRQQAVTSNYATSPAGCKESDAMRWGTIGDWKLF